MRGYSAIGLHNPKNPNNVGSVLRAAACYEAALIAFTGRRYRQAATDVSKAWRHAPLIHAESLKDVIPFGAIPVAVDLVEDATPLPEYKHPERAFYIFGPEDGTLGDSVLSWCPQRVMIPTRHCMNLAATVNVVLYDRLAKSSASTDSTKVEEKHSWGKPTISPIATVDQAEMVWTARDGTTYLISSMTTDHLLNTIRYLQRRHRNMVSEVIDNPPCFQGEMAQLQADEQWSSLVDSGPEDMYPCYLPMIEELSNRGVSIS
jgi:tRNA(Leu) C34 or U34 (ribose-2'-O)-methylase TrmL